MTNSSKNFTILRNGKLFLVFPVKNIVFFMMTDIENRYFGKKFVDPNDRQCVVTVELISSEYCIL